MSHDDARTLERLFDGDVECQALVDGWSDEQLSSAVQGHHFILGASPVARVLRGLIHGAIAPEQAQRWASFMRRGYVAGVPGRGSVDVDIVFDPDHEDVIVEAIARLDELGDLVDGQLRPGEAEQLLAALR
ncbi:MAG TPA: hypothetical protein VFH38_00405 [Jatrophihabitans sp.]|nr:hypothetical protein [Jatrophihabitans sp.]